MKTLIATEGSTLDSPVARRFERAAWYLIVDDEVHTLNACQPQSPHDHHKILARAAQDNVATVVAGKVGFGNLQLMSSFNFKVAYAHNMSAHEAVEKLSHGELRALVVRKKGERPPYTRGQKHAGIRECFAGGTQRGQHHLQQYSGRGH